MPFIPDWRRPTRLFVSQGDAYYSSVSLLLHMDGANGSTSFTDNSANAFTITASGSATVSTAQSKFGGASLSLPSGASYLTIPNNTAIDLSGDFTVEAWVRPTDLTALSDVAQGTESYPIVSRWGANANQKGWLFGIRSSGLAWQAGSNSVGYAGEFLATFSFSTNTWYHVATTRAGTTQRFFVDGALIGTSTNAYNHSCNQTGQVGIDLNASLYYRGYIDDLRITKGVARYTSAFTAPTEAFVNSP